MKILLIVLAFFTSGCSSVHRDNNTTQLVSIVLSSCQNKHEKNTEDNIFKLIAVNSKVAYEVLVSLLPRISLYESYISNSRDFCRGVIGVVGDLDSQTASIIHTLASRSNLSITLVASSAPSTFLPVTDLDLPNVLDMNPLQHYVEAMASLTVHQNWTRIGLISDNIPYYMYTAETLLKQLNFPNNSIERVLMPYFGVHRVSLTLEKLQNCGVDAIFIFMSEASLCSLLEEAKRIRYILPSHAWIMFDSETDFNSRESCDLDGLIMLKYRHIYGESDDVDVGNKSSSKSRLSFENMATAFNYSRCLHDSVLAVVARAEGIDFSNGSFMGVRGPLKFRNGKRLNNISVVKIIHGTEYEVAYYDSEFQHLKFLSNKSLITSVGSSGLTLIHTESSLAHVIIVTIVTTFCFVVVTVVLILYMYFRGEREIKATSVSVSLCMFTGCYLLLLHVILLLIAYEPAMKVAIPADIICNGLAWSSGMGLPSTLILATLFVKMLRVYSIFDNPFVHNKKHFNDSLLLVYIALMTSPTLVVLLLWSSIDPLINREIQLADGCGRLLILEACLGTHTFTWIILLLLYVAILIVSVAVLAFKSSKIRYKNFRDTKATNAFAFLTITLTVTTTFYWYFFYRLEPSVANFRATYITLYCGHNSIVMLCQIVLFLPKIYPPIRRKISRCKFTVQ